MNWMVTNYGLGWIPHQSSKTATAFSLPFQYLSPSPAEQAFYLGWTKQVQCCGLCRSPMGLGGISMYICIHIVYVYIYIDTYIYNHIYVWYKWWPKYLGQGGLTLTHNPTVFTSRTSVQSSANSWGSRRTWQIVQPGSNTHRNFGEFHRLEFGVAVWWSEWSIQIIQSPKRSKLSWDSNDKVWCPLSQHPELVQSSTTLLGSQRISTLHWADVVLIISYHLGLSYCKS